VTRLEVIRPFVEQTVKGFLGVDELKVMDDGTRGWRTHRAMRREGTSSRFKPGRNLSRIHCGRACRR
jgi:hypothetical protein